MRLGDGHRLERGTVHRSDRRRAEEDVSHDPAVHGRDEREEHPAALTQRVDNQPFLLLLEGVAMHTSNRLDVSRMLHPDLDRFAHCAPVR